MENTDIRNTEQSNSLKASVLYLVEVLAKSANFVRKQNELPLGLLKASMESKPTTKSSPVKSYQDAKLNNIHPGICQLSAAEVEVTRSAGSDQH